MSPNYGKLVREHPRSHGESLYGLVGCMVIAVAAGLVLVILSVILEHSRQGKSILPGIAACVLVPALAYLVLRRMRKRDAAIRCELYETGLICRHQSGRIWGCSYADIMSIRWKTLEIGDSGRSVVWFEVAYLDGTRETIHPGFVDAEDAMSYIELRIRPDPMRLDLPRFPQGEGQM